jgi:hypothetical protein
MAHLKLSEALLCLDCEALGSNPECCLLCTSRAVYPLAKFLNRPTFQIDRSFPSGPMIDTVLAAEERVRNG